WKLFEENDTSFYIISYDGLLSMLTALTKSKNKKDTSKKRKPVAKLVKKFCVAFQGLVLDEIHFCKNHDTLAFRLCNQLSKNCDFRYGLTGTPFGRKPIDLWSQFFLIDRGETLSETLGFFREAYFEKVGNGFGYDWVFIKEMEEDLHQAMRHKSIRYAEEELDSMPPKVYKTIKVPFSSEAYSYYELAHSALVEAQGNYEMLKNAFIRKRQIVAGYVDFKDKDENRQRITFKENLRLDALVDYVMGIPPKAKGVIFVEFTPSGDMIAERLKKAGLKFERLYSGTKDKIAAKDTFVTDPECRWLLANSRSGGVNLNLQVADYELFYECPVSPIVRRQAEKRAPRGGKTKTTFIVDFMVKNSVDEDVLEFIREGKDLFQNLIEGEVSGR
ncbi:DEAD/DEAH box helicase, partial [Candidatus Pacearchaeota archaeon]|nr:DEAD/DEAH box helicase [Candidatus Pacearchaeota archaeon]